MALDLGMMHLDTKYAAALGSQEPVPNAWKVGNEVDMLASAKNLNI